MLCRECEKRPAVEQGRCDVCSVFFDDTFDLKWEASQRPILETDDFKLELDMKWRDEARDSHMNIVRAHRK